MQAQQYDIEYMVATNSRGNLCNSTVAVRSEMSTGATNEYCLHGQYNLSLLLTAQDFLDIAGTVYQQFCPPIFQLDGLHIVFVL